MGTNGDVAYCRHVYEEVGEFICPYCGLDAHTVDWKQEAERHKEWIASGKAKFGGWWSI